MSNLEVQRQIYHQLRQLEPQRLYLVYDAPQDKKQFAVREQVDPAVHNLSPESEEILFANYKKVFFTDIKNKKSIFKDIPWECQIKTLSSKTNLWNHDAMLKAVRWFFIHEAEGIVIDGLNGTPFPAFFAFCSCLLEKYRHDERIGHISGRDFRYPDRKPKTNDSYYFSKLVHVSMGFASWQRVWKDVDRQLKTFHTFKKQNIIEDIPSHKPFRYIWHNFGHFDKNWDAQYEYINLINNRLSILPDMRNIPLDTFEIPEMIHPDFMVNPAIDEFILQERKFFMPVITVNDPDGITFVQKKLLSCQTSARQRMKIPRIIHQIYEDPAGPPENLLQIAESWKEKMPDWEYRFWNKQRIYEFIESTCPDFLPLYNDYPLKIQRWDAIRYYILFHIGGLYVDLDYECIQPLDMLLIDSSCCMGMEPTLNNRPEYNTPYYVGNSLMASIPGHPYMAAIIKDLNTNFSIDYGKGNFLQVLLSTGPLMITRTYEQYKRKNNEEAISSLHPIRCNGLRPLLLAYDSQVLWS